MAAIVIMLTMFGVWLDDWASAHRKASASDETYRVLQGVLAPAAWEDCVSPDDPLNPPSSCLTAHNEVLGLGHVEFQPPQIKDFYRLSPRNTSCNPLGTSAFSVRSATIEAFRPEEPTRPLRRFGENQREFPATRWAWTAVPALTNADLSVDVWSLQAIAGVLGSGVSHTLVPEGIWVFPADQDDVSPCHVIIVPVGHEVRYHAHGTISPVACVLAEKGPNEPC